MPDAEATADSTTPSDDDAEARLAFEEVPYRTRAVPLSHPDQLCLAGFLGGLRPVSPERARILEIGCGDAGNLVPLAFHLRAAELVGIDASEGALARGRESARKLGLDNLELRHAAIARLDPSSLGTFDYVIVHGVFSWISDEDRRALLALVRRVLDASGVAYVSYNTPQGWAVRAQVRGLLRRHAAAATSAGQRIALAREMLAVLAASAVADEHPYGHLLASELRLAASADDDYLLHEYLSPHNRAFTFREFRALTAEHGLDAFRELSAATSNPQLEHELRVRLARHADDDEIEECADLLTFRQLRATALRHADAARRAPSMDEVLSFGRYVAPLVPEDPDAWVGPRIAVSFQAPSGQVVTSSDPLQKAALLALSEAWPRGYAFDELLREAVRRVRSVPQPIVIDEEAIHRFALDLISLRTARIVHVTTRAIAPPRGTFERPEVSALTRLEAERGDVVTNPYHAVLSLSELDRELVRRFDGAHTVSDIVSAMGVELDRGELALVDGDREWSRERACAFLEERTEQLAQLMARCALLV